MTPTVRRRLLGGLLMLLALVALVGWWLSEDVPIDADRLTLMLRLRGADVEILDIQESADSPRGEDLQPLRLTQASVAAGRYPPGSEELVAAWTAGDGSSGGAHAWPLPLVGFADARAGGRTVGGELPLEVPVLRARLDVPRGAEGLLLLRTRVVGPALNPSLAVVHAAEYRLARPRFELLGRWLHGRRARRQVTRSLEGIESFAVSLARLPPLRDACWPEPLLPRDGNPPDPPRLLRACARGEISILGLDRCLDVVFVSEGFRDDEQDRARFDQRVDFLRARVLDGLQPYASFQSGIALHSLFAASRESGVRDCTQAKRGTYFGLRGNFYRNGWPGIVGTDSPCRVWREVASRVPEADVLVFVVNCGEWGGHAPLGQRMAFLTMNEDLAVPPDQVAAHELAHAFSGVTDEYVFCGPERNPLPPNIWKPANAAAELPPWSDLLLPEERTAGQDALSFVWLQNASCDPPPPGYEDKLGAFWGAAYADASQQSPACSACAGSELFFRPRTDCRMAGWTSSTFCPACCATLARRLDPLLPFVEDLVSSLGEHSFATELYRTGNLCQ